jgi:hypothetical protein
VLKVSKELKDQPHQRDHKEIKVRLEPKDSKVIKELLDLADLEVIKVHKVIHHKVLKEFLVLKTKDQKVPLDPHHKEHKV